MPERNRSEQEVRNGVDVNQQIDHLAACGVAVASHRY